MGWNLNGFDPLWFGPTMATGPRWHDPDLALFVPMSLCYTSMQALVATKGAICAPNSL